MTPSSRKPGQALLDGLSVVLGIAGLGVFGWLTYQEAAVRLTTMKLPPALLDKAVFFFELLKLHHWLLLVVGLLLAAWPFLRRASARKTAEAGAGSGQAARSGGRRGPRRFSACNVLEAGQEVRQLWQFSASGEKPVLQRHDSRLPNERLPAKAVGKDWQSLFQPRLNVAWLSADAVYLRALQLPRAEDPAELLSMVELQLEKVSPMPVAQVVWTFEPVPSPAGDLQTVIVVIVARQGVEEFLGQLEAQGYLADRLELPLLDQIRATRPVDDGLWIYTGISGDPGCCLAGWWYGGVLRNLSLVRLPADENRSRLFQEQIHQMTWAGELEGWLTSPPRCHLVADEQTAASWGPLFSPEQTVEVVEPVPASELAALTARRASRADAGVPGLLPADFGARYRQQFIDRLWMRGVGAAVLLYILVVVLYVGVTELAKWRLDKIGKEVTRLGPQYTNTLHLRAQVKVLQDQLDLQYAVLDCYKAIAEGMPVELTLDSVNFERGRKITLFGTAASEDSPKVQEFNRAMQKTEVKNQLLFARVQPASISPRPNNQVSWSFWCDLRRTDQTE